MANRAIVSSWGAAFVGRENVGLGLFMQAVQFFNDCKQKGEIEELRIYINANGSLSEGAGQMIVEGSAAQLAALVERDEYMSLMTKAIHVVQGFRTVSSSTGDEVMRRIEQLQIARKELGI